MRVMTSGLHHQSFVLVSLMLFIMHLDDFFDLVIANVRRGGNLPDVVAHLLL